MHISSGYYISRFELIMLKQAQPYIFVFKYFLIITLSEMKPIAIIVQTFHSQEQGPLEQSIQ